MKRRGARLVLALGACLAALAATNAQAARGGPTPFGYTWRDTVDGATYDVVPFDPSVTFVTPADDAPPLGPVPLAFAFPFHGSLYSQCWISDNGWLSFQAPANAFPLPRPLPDAAPPGTFLAPFWTDLQILPPGSIGYGPDPTGTIERVQFTGLDPATGTTVDFDALTWESGCIQFQYRTDQSLALASVGIENAPGTDAARASDTNRPADGFNIFNGQAIEFLPPPSVLLPCAAATPLACGSTPGNSPAAGADITTYCCGQTGFAAHEAVYSFTLTEPTEVSLQLTAATALRMFLLDSCNEHACLGAPVTSTTLLLGAGTYYVVVDGPSAADEGPFTIDLACTPVSTPLACPGNDSSTTAGGTSRWDSYACAPGRDLSGPEARYLVTVGSASNIIATVTAPGLDLDVLVLRAGPGAIGSEDCVAWGDDTATAWNVPAGQYLVVVDGVAGDSGAYTIALACGIRLTSVALTGTIDLGAARAQDVAGDTSPAANGVDRYSGTSAVFDGPEHLYELVVPQAGHVVVVPTSVAPGLSAFIADTRNEGTCVAPSGGGTCAMNLQAGTHYLVVDGVAGAAGPYVLRVAYEEPLKRWTSCERAAGTTLPSDSSSTNWHFDDGAPCVTDPMSYNYPDGCTFALYVDVPCGGSPHLSHFDSESGHVRVFDVLAGRYATLQAVSEGGWFQSGTDITWQIPDCSNPTDPTFDNVTVDVSLADPAEPCGIYRLEYASHAGSLWDLDGDCGGAASNVPIHDTLRTAVRAFAPLPQLGLETASVVQPCPDVMVSYALTNTGCAEARDVPVLLRDSGGVFATDFVPVILPGETLARSLGATMPTGSFGLMLVVDPDNVVAECGEAPSSACAVASGQRGVPLPDCGGPCSVRAALSITPSPACEGAPLVVSGASSSAGGCVADLMDYQLSGPLGVIRPWQGNPDFAGLVAGLSMDYTLEVRCALATTCSDTTTVPLVVERPPLVTLASVQAADVSSCNLGLRVSWEPAVFRGATGTGSYNVYRSEISCADALTSPPIASVLASTFLDDVMTAAGRTYHYVIEAEDDSPAVACTPGGTHGGSATRVAASGGACLGVTDVLGPRPDLLPRIGPRLRVGGSGPASLTTVTLSWTTDRPLVPGAGEHFHVLRSEAPDAGFAAVTTEPPPLQAPAFVDANAGRPPAVPGTFVWHYLVFSADACENENPAFDDL